MEEKRSIQCPQCRHQNSADAKFCSECGSRLGIRCGQCGAFTGVGAKFCPACGAALDPSRFGSNKEVRSAAREERRWATLLFADLAGFTKLSEKLDPEDVKALAHCCTRQLGEEVKRFGGSVITIAGDQVVGA